MLHLPNQMSAIPFLLTLLLVQISTQHSINPRLTNGENAARNQFRFMASLQTKLPLFISTYVHVCNGVVIDRYWILTTGFCVMRISGAGSHVVKVDMYFTEKEDNTVQIIKIANKIIHPNYNSSSKYSPYDLGLVLLKTPIKESVSINLSQPGKPIKTQVFIIGWGATSTAFFGNTPEVLQYALVDILEIQDCQLLFTNAQSPIKLQDSQMCTYSPDNSITGCTGDGGGPIMYLVNGKPEVLGLMNWSLGQCGTFGAPTVSTRISYFTDWIKNEMRNSSQFQKLTKSNTF